MLLHTVEASVNSGRYQTCHGLKYRTTLIKDPDLNCLKCKKRTFDPHRVDLSSNMAK